MFVSGFVEDCSFTVYIFEPPWLGALLLKFNFFSNVYFQIHWFSIFNSFMMVIFLVGLVWMILVRTLKKDYARYQKDEDLDDMVKIYN